MKNGSPYELTPGEVHLWISTLRLSDGASERCRESLSEKERKRALRFRFALHRDRFVAGRGILRQILGAYLRQPVECIPLVEGNNGKPGLACPEGAHIGFNVSHSESVAAYAITKDRRIGVDIELIRPIPHRDGIAQQFFAPEEQSEIAAFPPEERDFHFLACWTRKEAYLKAHGMGLSLPLHAFATTSGAGRPRLTRVDWDAGDVERWHFEHFILFDKYVGSVVVEGRQWQLITRMWPCGSPPSKTEP